MRNGENISARRGLAHCGRRAIESQRGASFALALLLFLVCVLLSSVVISASTAAVGRQAKLDETEQRYYSVSSAASLVESLFANSKVKVECAKSSADESQPTYTLKIGNLRIQADSTAGSGASYTLSQNEKNELSLPELTALYYLQQADAKDKIDLAATWGNLDFSSYNKFQAAQFELTTQIPTTDSKTPANVNDKTKVSITESFDEFGRLVLVVSSAPSEAADKQGDAYALTMTFNIDADTTGSSESVRVGTISWESAGIRAGAVEEVAS